MSDKVQVGTLPNGLKFFSVERDGRKMPMLNGRGMVDVWDMRQPNAQEFMCVLRAMDNPSKMKDVTP